MQRKILLVRACTSWLLQDFTCFLFVSSEITGLLHVWFIVLISWVIAARLPNSTSCLNRLYHVILSKHFHNYFLVTKQIFEHGQNPPLLFITYDDIYIGNVPKSTGRWGNYYCFDKQQMVAYVCPFSFGNRVQMFLSSL